MLVGPRTFNASMLAALFGNLSALQGRFDEAREWHDTALVAAPRVPTSPGPRPSAAWPMPRTSRGNR